MMSSMSRSIPILHNLLPMVRLSRYASVMMEIGATGGHPMASDVSVERMTVSSPMSICTVVDRMHSAVSRNNGVVRHESKC